MHVFQLNLDFCAVVLVHDHDLVDAIKAVLVYSIIFFLFSFSFSFSFFGDEPIVPVIGSHYY